MTLLLLIIIYIAFIGLGLPDSLFGTAWPSIYADFNLPISFGSFISVTVAVGTIISSLISAKLINKFGTDKISAFSTLLTAVALLGFSFSPNIWCMMLLSVPLGIGAGAIDVGLNNYVATHYSASQMSFLHCFYGIGVSVSPYVLSLVISEENGWRRGFRIAFLIQIIISLLMFISLPLWKKTNQQTEAAVQTETKVLSVKDTLKIPGVKAMCALFFLTCAIECSCSGWGSTYLVEHKGMSADKAAGVILLYFVGMAVGRFLSGVLTTKINCRTIIVAGMAALAVGIAMLFVPGDAVLSSIGLFMIGLGNGPLFPNYNYLAPENFGANVSQSVIGVQMTFAYAGIMLAPMLCGLLGQKLGMFIFPIYIVILFLVMLGITWSAKNLFAIPQKDNL